MSFDKTKMEIHSTDGKDKPTKPTDAAATSAKSELVKDAIPQAPKTNSEKTAIANQQARQASNGAPHDMTYQTANGKAVVGQEFAGPDGKPMVSGSDGKMYQGKYAKDGSIESLQPVQQVGKEFKPAGEPLKVTAERTGAPPSNMTPEQFVKAAAKETTPPVQKEQAKEPIKEAPKETSNLKESPKDSGTKDSSQKENLKEPVKETAPKDKDYREATNREAQVVREIPVAPSIKPEQKPEASAQVVIFKPAYIEQVARTSTNAEQAVPLSKIAEIKVQPLSANPEPVSKLAAGGPGDQRTAKDDDKITRKDTTDKHGDKPGLKPPIDFKGIPLPFMIGREPGRPEGKVRIDKADGKADGKPESREPKADGKLSAKLEQLTDTHRTRLSEVIKAIEKNPERQFTNPTDRNIASKVRALEPQQVMILKDWLSGKTLPNFSEISKPLQIKLAGILEAVISKAQPQAKPEGKQETVQPKIETVQPKAETVQSKADAKTEKTQTDKTVRIELEDKTVPIRSVKSEFAESETTKTSKITESAEAESGDERKVNEVQFSTQFLDEALIKIRPRQKPKTRQHETVAVIEKEMASTSETIRISSSGSTDTRYVLTLETILNNVWVKVREYRVTTDLAEYFIFKRSGGQSVQTLQLSRAQLSEMMKNDFKRNAQKHVNEFLG